MECCRLRPAREWAGISVGVAGLGANSADTETLRVGRLGASDSESSRSPQQPGHCQWSARRAHGGAASVSEYDHAEAAGRPDLTHGH